MKSKYLYLLLASIGFASCKSDFKNLDTPSAGTADFSTYIALGNSLTAGYADNSLTRSGQEMSYPNMLASQFKYVGSGDFLQPLLPGNYGWPNRALELGSTTSCLGVTSLGPIPYQGGLDTVGSSVPIANRLYNNLGVPGIKIAHYLVNGYGLLNPYAGRFYSNPNVKSPFDIALEQHGSFYTVWLGSNDVLAYAVSGGSGSNSGLGLNDITPIPVFQMIYDSLVNNITRNGAKGVLISIPEVTNTPFFNTINPKGLNLSSAEAAQLTAAYAGMGASHVTFTEGENYFVVEDDVLGVRKMKAGEYLLLTTPGDSLRCGGWGSMRPIPKQFVLDEDEVVNVKFATTQFNNIIAEAAERTGIAFLDINNLMQTLTTGYKYDGVSYSPTFVTGGTYSLDGIHLSPRGYALVANEIIKATNLTYKSSLPMVNVNQYPGIKFP